MVALVVVDNQGDIAGILSLTKARALIKMTIGDGNIVFFS